MIVVHARKMKLKPKTRGCAITEDELVEYEKSKRTNNKGTTTLKQRKHKLNNKYVDNNL